MKDIVKVGWSGGKDSTCSVLLHIEKGDKVKAVCYIPMFTKDIPLITKNHYEFIVNTAERLRKMGADVHIVSGMTYYDYVSRVITKGKNKGKIRGFPITVTGLCDFKNKSKLVAINKCDVGNFDYYDMGIAYDEVKRQAQLNDAKRSILFELKYTEQMAKQKCIDYDMLSPHYENSRRDGCALCYNAPKKTRDLWLADYPEARELVIQLQDIVKEQRPDRPPLRNYEYFIETDVIQLSIFD